MFGFMKEVKVTNPKNILVQVPRAVASMWGVQVGDKLEVTYEEGKIIIKPSVHGRGDASTEGR